MGVDLPPFQELVDAYWRDVARLCAALAGPVDGEDVAQHVWVKALEAYPSAHAANLRGWLVTIAVRAAADRARRRSRHAVPMAVLPDRAVEQDRSDDGEVWRGVRTLPARQREAVVLRYVLDLTHEQIADALGTTPAATRRLVSDGLATLRDSISKDGRR